MKKRMVYLLVLLTVALAACTPAAATQAISCFGCRKAE